MWVTAGGEWNQPVTQPGPRPSCVIHWDGEGHGAGGAFGGDRSGPRDFYEQRHTRVCFHTSGNTELFLGCHL